LKSEVIGLSSHRFQFIFTTDTLLSTITNLGAELPRRSCLFNGIRRTPAEFDPSGGSPKPYKEISTQVASLFGWCC